MDAQRLHPQRHLPEGTPHVGGHHQAHIIRPRARQRDDARQRANQWLTERYLLRRTLSAYRTSIERHAPDLVVSIHPYLSMTLSAIKRRGGTFRYAVVVVDLASLLRGWADPEAELVVSPTQEASQALRAYGVEGSRIVDPLFPLSLALRRRHHDEAVTIAEHLVGCLRER